MAELAEAVQYLADRGILHWDVKPSRILITHDGKAVLSGLVSHAVAMSEASSLPSCGTPAYMPPERTGQQSTPYDTRCTTYSLGVILYELLTGVLPFHGSCLTEILQSVLNGTAVRPRSIQRSIPKDLESICLKAMARKPEDRQASPGELAQELRKFLEGVPDRRRSFWKRK